MGGLVLSLGACSAPISTIRSPAHPRVVELHNTTNETLVLEIEPAAFQNLGAPTTFTGRLRAGETKILYLYSGFTYRFRLVDASGESDEVRQDFRVASDLQLAYEGDSLVAEGNPTIEVGEVVLVGSLTYDDATEAQLDDLVRRLDGLLPPGARSEYRTLPPEGKRQFVLRFWASRDPTPGTPENEFREEIEARLAVIESRFRMGAEMGAETPRGRIYLKYGKPDRLIARTLATELAKPYEVWQYFSTGYTYVFLDELRSGRFVLLTSTDPNDPGLPDWSERIPAEAAEEILGPRAGPPRDVEAAPSVIDRGFRPRNPTAKPSRLRVPMARPSRSRGPAAGLHGPA